MRQEFAYIYVMRVAGSLSLQRRINHVDDHARVPSYRPTCKQCMRHMAGNSDGLGVSQLHQIR